MASSESSSLPENVPSMDQTKAMIIDELEHGRELATQLRDMLSGGGGGGESSGSEAEIAATGDLVARIMTSFSNSLSWLDQNDTVVKAENSNYEVMSSDLDGGRKSEDSEESNCRSSSSPPPARSPKDRRGSYKRRRTSHSWMKETPTETNDGHAWRKYGQKRILKAKYPRNYFRCTHKYDQQCQATKDVQRIQEEPPMFRTTYYGRHTCRALSTAPELVLDCLGPTHTSAVLLSFNTTANNNNYIHDLNNLAAKHSLHSPPFNSLNAATTITNTPHLVKQEYINNNNGEILLGVDDQIITSPYNCHNNINNMIDNMAHQDQQYQGDVNSGEVINNYNMDTPFDDFHQYFNDLI